MDENGLLGVATSANQPVSNVGSVPFVPVPPKPMNSVVSSQTEKTLVQAVGSQSIRTPITGEVGIPRSVQAIEKKKKSGLGVIIKMLLILILLGVITGGGFWAYQKGVLGGRVVNLNSLMVKFGLVGNVDEDTEVVDQTAEATPTTMPVSPTPTVVVPVSWRTFSQGNCGFSVSYPLTWQSQQNCVTGVTGVDCLMTSDYVGELNANNYVVDQGMVMLLSCNEFLSGGETGAGEMLLSDCLKSGSDATTSGMLSCEAMEVNGRQWVIFNRGQYKTVQNDKVWQLEVRPAPPTTFSLLEEILGTVR